MRRKMRRVKRRRVKKKRRVRVSSAYRMMRLTTRGPRTTALRTEG